VRAITRVAGWDNEAALVEMARASTAAHVARTVAAMRQAERVSESKTAFDAYRHRTFTCRTDDSGTLVLIVRWADGGATRPACPLYTFTTDVPAAKSCTHLRLFPNTNA